MKGLCPKCGQPIDLDQAVKDQAGQDLLAELARLGARSALVMEYVNGFRAAPGSAMSAAKTLRLVRDVRALGENGEFGFDGVAYRVSLELLDEGLRAVANKIEHGLTNHHYLYQVLRALIAKRRSQPASARPQVTPGRSTPAIPERAGGDIPIDEIREFNDQLANIGRTMPDVKGEHE